MHLDTNEKCMSVQQKTVSFHPQSGLYTADENSMNYQGIGLIWGGGYLCVSGDPLSAIVFMSEYKISSEGTFSLYTTPHYELKCDANYLFFTIFLKGEFAAAGQALTAKQPIRFLKFYSKTHVRDTFNHFQ